MNYVDEILSVTGKVRFYGTRFTGGKESICSEAVRNVGASSAVSATTEGTIVPLYLKKAGLASRNIVHVLKNILRCVGFCLYILDNGQTDERCIQTPNFIVVGDETRYSLFLLSFV